VRERSGEGLVLHEVTDLKTIRRVLMEGIQVNIEGLVLDGEDKGIGNVIIITNTKFEAMTCSGPSGSFSISDIVNEDKVTLSFHNKRHEFRDFAIAINKSLRQDIDGIIIRSRKRKSAE
jgi:hypothetical protein